MIIQLLSKIPIKIYLYIIIFSIILFAIVGLYCYMNLKLNVVEKAILIWFVIILEINMIHLYFILSFYKNNLNKKGETGDIGTTGPRGFKGEQDMCRSCGGDGSTKTIYAGTTNDNGVKRDDKTQIVGGQCQFPFIDNNDYQYKCIKTKLPIEIDKDTPKDAHIYGWCATEVDDKKNPTKIGYCNENRSINEKNKLQARYLRNRKHYLQNNRGITDLRLVADTTSKKAKKQCDEIGDDYITHEQDLNEGTGGKFIHMCYRTGLGNKGVSDIRIMRRHDTCSGISKENECNHSTSMNTNKKEINCEWKDGICIETKDALVNKKGDFTRVDNMNLNKDSGDGSNKTGLYLYQKISNTGFIRDIKVLKDGKKCDDKELDGYINPGGSGYSAYSQNLNWGSSMIDGTTKNIELNLCISKDSDNIIAIDTAFVYKDNNLYFFKGNNFYKMSKKPINNALKVEKKYPKDISEKWFKHKLSKEDEKKKNVEDCFIYNTKPKHCNKTLNCVYDEKQKQCEPYSNYNAVFTYGYDGKTYFFKGDKVYLYDDKKMGLASGYPKKIKDVFEGVPDNINAVFTWGNDGKTYFFKGSQYYKYDDKNKKVLRGYPREVSGRWNNMPIMIDAIFTLPSKISSSDPEKPTFVISGDRSWVINPTTYSLEKEKSISERFMGLEVVPNYTTKST